MKTRNEYRAHRHRRVRSRVVGTATAPRLAIFKSLRNISAQVIDDVSGKTLVAASNHDVKKKTNATVDIARQVGKLIAERAKAAKITKIVFDRGGNVYHGQVKALAEGAREGGLEF